MTNSKKRVLVAEDNRILADVIRFNLTRGGFDVTVAANGAIALEHLRREEFDVLITDMQMPQLNGEELCRAVREQLHNNHMPILLCSAKGLEIDTERIKTELGVREVIFKPFSMREISRFVLAVTNSTSVPLAVTS